jgi:DNA-binding NarL/FixJ family response regulator
MIRQVDSATTPVGGRPTGVAIVEDRAAIRRNVVLLIELTPGFRCAGSYPDMEEALRGIGQRGADVVLVDLILPGMSGTEGIRRLRRCCPQAAPVVFTVFDEDERVFDALCAGALGCLPKKTEPRALLASLAAVAAGGAAPIPPDVARRVLERLKRAPQEEMRLLGLLAEGHNSETAARDLHLTIDRVGRIARSVCSRLHASFRTESVR